jgi:hypothetical protein
MDCTPLSTNKQNDVSDRIFFALLGIESRVLDMLGKCSTTELYPHPRNSLMF